MRIAIFTLINLLICILTSAQNPTVSCSNASAYNVKCDKAMIKWTNGNGSNRLVVIEPGNTRTFTPTDLTYYLPGFTYGNAKVVFNVVADSIGVFALQKDSTYTVSIFEYNFVNAKHYYLSTGASVTFKTKNITLLELPRLHVCQQKEVEYSLNLDWPNNDSLSYVWTFADSVISTDANPVHTFEDYGRHKLLIQISSDGCEASFVYNDTVAPLPLVDFYQPADTPNNDTIQCLIKHGGMLNRFYWKNTSFSPSLGTGWDIVNVYWDFGDGTTSNYYNGRKTYNEEGKYIIKLKIISRKNIFGPGCKDSAYKSITVRESYQPADVAYNSLNLCPGSTFEITYNGNSRHLWTDGRDTILTSSFSKYFSQIGHYYLDLYFPNDSFACNSNQQFEIQINALPDTFNLGPDKTVEANAYINLVLPQSNYYFWNTGDTTRNLIIRGNDLQKGPNIIWGRAGSNPYCYTTDTLIIFRKYGTNVEELSLGGLEAYPNPSSSLIHFEHDQPFRFIVYNAVGSKIYESQNLQMNHSLNTSNYPSGIYHVTVITGSGSFPFRFIRE